MKPGSWLGHVSQSLCRHKVSSRQISRAKEIDHVHSRGSNSAIHTAIALRGRYSIVGVLIVFVLRNAVFIVDLIKTSEVSIKDTQRSVVNFLEVTIALSSSIGRSWIEWQFRVFTWGEQIWVRIVASSIVECYQELLVVARVDLRYVNA